MSTEINNDQFAKKICELVSDGFGLTPFMGSGCSASSGIMMGQEFSDYLGYSVYISVQGDHGKPDSKKWEIAKNGWPERPNESEILKARKWACEVFLDLIKNYGMRADLDDEFKVINYVLSGPVSSPELLAKLLTAPVVPNFIRSHKLMSEDAAIKTIQETIWGKKAANEHIIFTSKSETSEAGIFEQAFRSLSDWRATLHFLATLRYGRHRDGSVRVSIGKMDPSIIDRFNVHITKNKKPNLTHQMMAQLSMSARIRVILTTNFDKLIENSFETFGRQLSTIPVGLHGGLPHPDLVHGNDCLVKLHGDSHETRADFTLDEAPTPVDKDRFFHYIRGNYPAFSDSSTGERRYIPSHLLVVGYSGSDRRCNDMIKYVLDSDDEAKVYWICHSNHDLQRLNNTFNEADYVKNQRLIATETERPDLLLYDIYQKLNLTLPSAGTTYQFPDRVIPARSPLPNDSSKAAETDAEEIEKYLVKKSDEEGNGSIVVLSGESGVLTVMYQTFERLRSNNRHRVWLELEDYPDAASVGAEIRTGLSIRTGSLPLGHVKPLPTIIVDEQGDMQARVSAWKKFFIESSSELGISPKMWVIGLYGRNGAGGCVGWEADRVSWDQTKYEELESLIYGLSQAGFNVLYAPYLESRSEKDTKRFEVLRKLRVNPLETLENDYFEDNAPWGNITPHTGTFNDGQSSAEDGVYRYECSYRQPKELAFDEVLRKICGRFLEFSSQPTGLGSLGYKNRTLQELRNSVRALYSGTLFRQSRHFSAFISEAFYRCPNQFNLTRVDNDEKRFDIVNGLINELNKCGVFYIKPGGFAWAYRDIRLGLRHLIETLHRSKENVVLEEKRMLIRLKNFASQSHFYIGEWYAKAHRVTGHPLPMIEGLHHFYQAAILAGDIESNYGGYEENRDSFQKQYTQRAMFFFSSMIALVNLLKAGEGTLRYWSSVPFRKFMFGGNKRTDILAKLETVGNAIFNTVQKGNAETTKEDSVLIYARGIIDDIKRELTNIENRISSDYRVTDISFQKNIPENEYYNYKIDSEKVSSLLKLRTIFTESYKSKFPNSDPKQFVEAADIISLIGLVYKTPVSTKTARKQLPNDIFRRKIRDIEYAFLLGVEKCIINPHEINLFIQALVEWSFIFVRRAKKLYRGCCWQLKENQQEEDFYRDFLIVTILCNMALDLCRLLPAAYSECVAKGQIKALSIYGLALGRLGRFREAYRRLGEARVICRSMKSDEGIVLLGIAELRRAEVLCLDAREIGAIVDWLPEASKDLEANFGNFARKFRSFSELHELTESTPVYEANQEAKDKARNILARRLRVDMFAASKKDDLEMKIYQERARLNRILQAKIGDAWRCLEESRRCFSGRTSSLRWWGRQYALELRVFGESGLAIQETNKHSQKLECFRMLPFRTKKDLSEHLDKLWRLGIAVAGTGEDADKYNRIKITWIYLFSLSLGPQPDASQESYSIHRDDLLISKDEKHKALNDVWDFLLKEFHELKEVMDRNNSKQPHKKETNGKQEFFPYDKSNLPKIADNLDGDFYLRVINKAWRLLNRS